jgi:hypothetical protein
MKLTSRHSKAGVIPAKAGIQFDLAFETRVQEAVQMDSRFRGNDDIF